MTKQLSFRFLFILPLFLLIFSSCEEIERLQDEPTPTRDLMHGVWEVVEAYDTSGNSIVDQVNFLLPTYLKFDDYNSVSSTAGPMFMYIVYGKNRFTDITSKLDAAFDYISYNWTTGEYGIKDGVQNEFTIEMKLKFPTTGTIDEILDLMNINPPQLFEPIIYHKFLNVNIQIDEDNPKEMIIEFDDNVEPIYNIKDSDLNYVLWDGVNVNAYSRSYFILKKRSTSLRDLIDNSK